MWSDHERCVVWACEEHAARLHGLQLVEELQLVQLVEGLQVVEGRQLAVGQPARSWQKVNENFAIAISCQAASFSDLEQGQAPRADSTTCW